MKYIKKLKFSFYRIKNPNYFLIFPYIVDFSENIKDEAYFFHSRKYWKMKKKI